ncbi:hypothetical protein HD554DRAFT_2031241 [Boletus coccyginus]|nr:hypothetical protein HD554DRAFT_2031241 [Boletus coccyginus]
MQTRATTKRIDSGQGPPHATAVTPSRTKKRRVDGTESSKKQRRGKPGELCQLNLDVLFLLAAYVHPLDLLNLARTCKSLRELLMDKASEFVWKTARGQVRGLPDCPADMTEPEYANLVFYSRCHVRTCTDSSTRLNCSEVLSRLQRRTVGLNVCFSITIEFTSVTRLRSFSSCPDIILQNSVLPTENLTVDEEGKWVDKEQLESFIEEYNRSSDKERFLNDRQELCFAIQQRLKQHGYGPEIEHFGHYAIRQPRASFFKTSRPLTDKEWARMWPEWFEIMSDFRSQRMDKTVYQPRRNLLVTEYNSYVTSPSSNAPSFDLLPHVIELGCFPPFRDIIKAPEGTDMSEKPFESAFAQLPVLVDEWRKQLDAELAELVEIPSQLSRKGASSGRAVSSSSETLMESFQAPTDKLHLACAVFTTFHPVTWYPDVFFSMLHHLDPIHGKEGWEREMPIQDRFSVKYIEDAPYIVRACGLDPNVATVEDMDRRDARLKCLSCNNPYIRSWRGAVSLSADRAERSEIEHGMPIDSCVIRLIVVSLGRYRVPTHHAGSSSATSIWMQSRLPSCLPSRNPPRHRCAACYAVLVLET